MNVYPDLPGPKSRALARDVLVLLLLIVFAWLGTRVYHDVDQLSSLGRGVTDAARSVKSGFSSAAAAVGGVPLAGSAIAGALRDAGNTTGGNAAAVGASAVDTAHHLALVLGLLTWAIPSLLLLLLVLPRRMAEARRLHAARRAALAGDQEHKRLLAVRAILTRSDDELFSRSSDPGGDLLAGRYEALVAAELEANGVRVPTG